MASMQIFAHQPGCPAAIEGCQILLKPSILSRGSVVVVVRRQRDEVDAWEVYRVVARVP